MMVMVIPASPLTDTAARRVLRCIAPVYSLAVIVRRFAVCLLLRPCRLRRSRRRPLQVQPDGAVITTAKAMAILTVTENLRCLDAVHQLRGYQREVDTHALAIVLRADPVPSRTQEPKSPAVKHGCRCAATLLRYFSLHC
jgi:hypothetical protein